MEKQNLKNKLIGWLNYCSIAMILLCCFFISFTFSWLTTSDSTATTKGTSTFATASASFLNGETQVVGEDVEDGKNFTYNITTSEASTPVELDLSIKNTGNAKLIVRISYTIYVGETSEVLPIAALSNITFGENWISHNLSETQHSGYLFYDGAFNVNQVSNFITSITAAEGYANTSLSINVTAEYGYYDGNAYTNNTTPVLWESYPSNWSILNN